MKRELARVAHIIFVVWCVPDLTMADLASYNELWTDYAWMLMLMGVNTWIEYWLYTAMIRSWMETLRPRPRLPIA